MDDDNRNRSRTDRQDNSGSQRELKDALERLEKAVEELAGTAKDEWAGWADRATTFIDDTSARLEQEVENRRRRSRTKQTSERSFDSQVDAGLSEPGRRASGLYRDRQAAKLGGVCAGLARYWGMEPWMVRCIAITGLLFVPGIVFPAYIIAWIVLSDPPGAGSETRGRRRQGKRRGRSRSRSEAVTAEPPMRDVPPREQFRNVQSVLSQAELRLRRMETHITSGHYELQKELHALDQEPAAKPSS